MDAQELKKATTYHPPREDQIPKYAAIDKAFGDCWQIRLYIGHPSTDFNEINRVIAEYVRAINENAPGSADRSAAFRCAFLARNALCEALASARAPRWLGVVDASVRCAEDNLLMAKWQSKRAIAMAPTPPSGDDRCASCDSPRNDHPYRHMFVEKKRRHT